MSKLDVQIGGSHYKDMKIQPIEYIHANGLGYSEGAVIKYVSRWKNKNGVEDLRKAIHLLELLIELEQKDMPIGNKDSSLSPAAEQSPLPPYLKPGSWVPASGLSPKSLMQASASALNRGASQFLPDGGQCGGE